MKRAFLGLPIAALLLMTLGVSPTLGVSFTYVVDDDGKAVIGDCDDPTPTYATIPLAVAAASSGDIVLVCPGNYNAGQIVVSTPNLRIRGAHWGDSAQACVSRGSESKVFTSAGPGGTGAFWLQANNITIDGFLIEDNAGPGIQTDSTYSGYKIFNNLIRNNVMGLYLQSNPLGNSVRTKVWYNCFLSNNVGPSAGNGNGIYTDAGLRNVTIFSNTFRHNENAGMIMFGAPSFKLKNVNITSNTSLNDKTFLAVWGASGFFIEANTVTSDSGGYGNEGSAIRIGAGSNSVTLNANIIDSDHYAGIALREDADNVLVLKNVISHTDIGIDVSTTEQGGAHLRKNTITDVNDIGLYLEFGTAENQVARNSVSGSGSADCQDDTIGDEEFLTANHWVNNTGAISVPAGLCAP